jgi:hypothetical protein
MVNDSIGVISGGLRKIAEQAMAEANEDLYFGRDWLQTIEAED